MSGSIKDTITLNNGVEMPLFGLGVYLALENEAVDAVKWAVDAGYRHIDTAAIYQNEVEIGRGVAECSVPREELFITTKVWNNMQGYDSTLKAFDESLDKLGMDYLDLYLIHWPCPDYDKYVDTWKAMEKLYADKRVRAIGVSNFLEPWLERLADECEVVPAVNQMEFHPYMQKPELREYCKSKGIAYESYSTLGRGAVLSDPVIVEMAKKYGKTPAQLTLKFAVQQDIIVIPKSVHKDRIVENTDIYDFEISPEDIALLATLDKDLIICGGDPVTLHMD